MFIKIFLRLVLVFLICWTPYYTISVLFWINPTAAMKIDDRVYNFLFIFAVSNCLGNPLAYGKESIEKLQITNFN
jgi:gonadotropin-releasing hormone receptor